MMSCLSLFLYLDGLFDYAIPYLLENMVILLYLNYSKLTLMLSDGITLLIFVRVHAYIYFKMRN